MKKQNKHMNLSRLLAFAFSVIMLTGFWPQRVGFLNTSLTLPDVQAAGTLKNPRIVKNTAMHAKQKVTWDCVYFGNYPQSEVTAKNGTIYKKLQTAKDWDNNNDVIIDGTKYRRLKGNDSTYYTTQWYDLINHYNWNNNYTTYHYFKYEPIKWRVLNTENGRAFLLADVTLDGKKYNNNQTSVTWENSSIRSWLNGYGASVNEPHINYASNDFINVAFNASEKKAIQTTMLVNAKNYEYADETTGGNNTFDKVFLLSESDVYFTNEAKKYGFVADYPLTGEYDEDSRYDEGKQTGCSTYAYAAGASRNTIPEYKGNAEWLLRSPGRSNDRAAHVGYDGWVAAYGYGVAIYDGCVGIRPALYLNLTNSVYSYAGTVSSDRTVTNQSLIKKPDTVKVSAIRLSGLSKQIAAGKKLSLKADVFPSNTSNKNLTWKSSNTKIATVTHTGIVSVKKNAEGKKVIITATAQDGSGTKASWKITCMKNPVKKIKIYGVKKVKAGKNLKLKSKVISGKKANKKLLWLSGNTTYATVNANGLVKTKKVAKGKTVKIIAMATDGSGKKCVVKIKIK